MSADWSVGVRVTNLEKRYTDPKRYIRRADIATKKSFGGFYHGKPKAEANRAFRGTVRLLGRRGPGAPRTATDVRKKADNRAARQDDDAARRLRDGTEDRRDRITTATVASPPSPPSTRRRTDGPTPPAKRRVVHIANIEGPRLPPPPGSSTDPTDAATRSSRSHRYCPGSCRDRRAIVKRHCHNGVEPATRRRRQGPDQPTGHSDHLVHGTHGRPFYAQEPQTHTAIDG